MNFFQTAKWFELVFVPGNFLVVLLCLGLVLLVAGWRRSGLALCAIPVVIFLAMIFLPLNFWTIRPLEDRFARPSWPAHVEGIVVLGGGEEQEISATRNIPTMLSGEGVLVAVVELMRRYPKARVIFSGGSAYETAPGRTEAAVARGIFDQLGADQSRITYEDRSRSTWENLVFSQRLARPRPQDRWLLVTFAVHMPRSMGVARKIGWPMTPWPADYETRGDGKNFVSWNLAANLSQFEMALHEWIGLGAYWWTGKSAGLFPRP